MIQIECCDNLELMSKIENGTVDLIYCDILYGTGRNFMDYKDLYPIREIIEEHYIPRIKEMHRILKDTGSIYLQMDYRINHWVRLIMDGIFGYANFRNEIIWCYKNGGHSPIYNKKHDTILFYTKTDKFIFNKQYVAQKEKTKANHKIGLTGSRGVLNEKGVQLSDWWDDITTSTKFPKGSYNNLGYFSQKPKALIERIIKASSNEGDLVADFYLGSGTTAEVCKDLNRNFIGCDINPRAVELSKMRCGVSF